MIFFAKGVSPWPKSPPQAEQKPVPQTTTPPARNSRIAVEEEYQIARQQGTAQALELFSGTRMIPSLKRRMPICGGCRDSLAGWQEPARPGSQNSTGKSCKHSA